MKIPRLAVLALSLLAARQERPAGPLSPGDALATFRVPDGFHVELVAAEPDVMDPVAIAFDEDGRLYVAEMADYPLGPAQGRIKRLEDRDGDGRYERVTTFAAPLPMPKGVMPWRGGVLVTAAPDILFLKDTDGDGKADVREVVFTGFSPGNPQHRVNGLQFALDNWIYGANGDSGGTLRRGNQPAAPAVAIGNTDFRFRPDFSGLEPVAGRSQFANTFDDWGNRFINNNSNHIIYPVLPLRYVKRNPNLPVPAVQETIPEHGAAARIFPASAVETRFNDPRAAGHFTSACSVTVYRGAAFPEEYRGNAFTCEPVHNLVHRDLLVERGGTFVAQRADADREFLASTDNWFRPVNLAVGPEGALYVVDFYRAVVEHPQWIPLDVQKRINLRAGDDRGRIWRVVHKDAHPSPRPRLGTASPAELVAHLESANGWWRLTAQRLLVERRDKAAVEPLRRLAAESRSPLGRLHALRTLEALGELDPALLETALRDAVPQVREHALRMAEPALPSSAALRAAVLAAAKDAPPRLRFQLALTLGEMPGDEALDMLVRIAARDADDRWTRLAILTSIRGDGPKLLARLRALSPGFLEKPHPGAIELVRQLADLVGSGRREEDVVEWLRLLGAGGGAEPARWQLAALSALGPSLRRWGVGLESLLRKAGIDRQVSDWTNRLVDSSADPARDVPERVNAVDLLALLPVESVPVRLEKLLRPQEPQDVQVAVVRALASWPGDPMGARLLDGWATYTAPVRREVLRAALARPDRVGQVVDRLEKGEVRVVELEAHHRDQLLKLQDRALRERSRKVLEDRKDSEIEQAIRDLSPKVLALQGDPVRGEKAYMTHCATCHRLHGQGFKVGPGLETVAGRDKKALFTDILSPNRAIDPAYQVYVVRTPGKEMLSGVIAAETPTSLTLRRAQGEETTVLRRDIAEIKAWPASMMPEGLEKNLTPQDFADLLEFLQLGAKK